MLLKTTGCTPDPLEKLIVLLFVGSKSLASRFGMVLGLARRVGLRFGGAAAALALRPELPARCDGANGVPFKLPSSMEDGP